jgi:hypothetical protein
LAGAAPPAQARYSIKKAIWGPPSVFGASQFPMYRDLGVGTYETAVNWHDIAPTRPATPRDPNDSAYQWWSGVDEAVAEARRYGIRVAIQVVGAPEWANGGHPWNWAPLRERDFTDFLYAVARRYPGIRLWMIWAEPSTGKNFQPLTGASPGRRLNAAQASAPRRYARLLDASYAVLKRINRGNRVIGGMTFTTGDITAWQWIAYMRLPNGRPPRMDLYGHNPFSFRFPNLRSPPGCCGIADFSDLGRLHRAVDRNLRRRGQRTIPLFLSEFMIPTDVDRELNFHVDPATQAAWIRAALRTVRRTSWIAALGWIHVYDDQPSPNGDPVSHSGLIGADSQRKPGYFAFRDG